MHFSTKNEDVPPQNCISTSREEEARSAAESSLYARQHGLGAASFYAAEDGAEELPLELTKHSAEDRLSEAGGQFLFRNILERFFSGLVT